MACGISVTAASVFIVITGLKLMGNQENQLHIVMMMRIIFLHVICRFGHRIKMMHKHLFNRTLLADVTFN